MREAVIVSTARTPLAKGFRGAFNKTHGVTMTGHAIEHAVKRAGIEGAEVEDVIVGVGFPEGATGFNHARGAALRAGLPVTTSGTTINRFCSSGLQAISSAAHRVIADGVPVAIGAGVEQISVVGPTYNLGMREEDWLTAHHPDLHMPMIDTAETVAKRYGIGREAQDAYALQSQQRTAAAQEAGKFDNEIVPLKTMMAVKDKATGEVSDVEVCLEKDEGNRPSTTLEGLAKLEPVRGEGFTITAGNASQLSDGASACVVMDAKLAEKRVCSRWASTAAWRWRAWSPTKWASARSMPSRAFWSARGSRWTTSICGNSTRPLPCRCSTAATSWVFRARFSTSTAAPSPSATPMACRAHA